MQNRYIDLSHSIFDGLVTYKGLPAAVVCDYWAREDSAAYYSDGSSFHIGRIDMVANTGTYLDVPFHRFADGDDLEAVGIGRLVDLPGISVHASGAEAITIAHLEGLDVKGKAVLLHTGWSRHWNTPVYFEGHPFCTAEAATWLRDNGAVLVGIDSHNIDDTRHPSRPVHTTLLEAGILIAEHLTNLHLLPQSGFLFNAAPPKIRGCGTFPVRAYAALVQ